MKTRVVQIVHYSDLHIVGPNYLAQRGGLDAIKKYLPSRWQQGIAAASISALRTFEAFLQDISGEPEWQGLPIWLIDTGDGTTFGDDESLDSWLNTWSPKFHQAAGPTAKQLILYGNHDAWPRQYPLLAPRQMAPHRDALRHKRFAQTWPMAPLRAPLSPGNPSEVQLYALNSVDHRAVANAAARGLVVPDRFWQGPGAMPGPTASHDLDREALSASSGAGARHLRLLAMHYPAAAAAQAQQSYLELLANRDTFGQDLLDAHHKTKPLAHLLLAGHTHSAFPPLGLLPNALSSASHAPLPDGVGQLVCGSLSQKSSISFNGSAAPISYPKECSLRYPYQCTLLRLFATPAQGATEVTVQRTLVGRAPGGPFGYLPVAEGSSRTVEEIEIVI